MQDEEKENITTKLDELEKEGFIIATTSGTSMQPLIYASSTQVCIRKLDGEPKKHDVVLYVRPNGQQVLHRIISVRNDTALIRGDNTFALERVPVSNIKGVLDVLWRGKKEIHVSDISYNFYVWFWNLIYPLRFIKYHICAGVAKSGKYLLGDTTLGWIIRMSRESLGRIGLMTAFTCMNAFLSVILALVLRETIDYAVSMDRASFLRWTGIFLAVVVIQLALRATIRQMEELVSSSVENQLKEHTYQNILHSTYSSLKSYHTGELLNRLTNDTKVIGGYAALLLPGVAAMAVQLGCALAVLMYLDWHFGRLLLVAGIVLSGVTLLFRRKMKQLHKNVQEADGRLRSWLQESVESMQILKSFEAENMAETRTRRRADEHKKERMKRQTFSNICNVGFGIVMQGSYLFGLVWCGLHILNGTMTYGTLTAVLQLISQIRSPMANISGYIPQYYAMIASAERLMEIEKFPKDKPKYESLPEFHGLSASNLTFRFDDGEEDVIYKASFEIKKGEIVAITGMSGIGKSTLLRILMGLYSPTGGKLTADGMDIDAGTRAWFSYVPQGNMLMAGSIYESVEFLHSGPFTKKQKEKIEDACRIACADEFIRTLPEGYETVLGEKGAGLSEGQMQRIAIARAVYRDAPVLLLDEATSALDEKTESHLLQNLKESGNRTVIIVTHRPAALEICSKRLEFIKSTVRVIER